MLHTASSTARFPRNTGRITRTTRSSRGAKLSNFNDELLGCGPGLHNDPRDRPREIFGGTTTLHFGPDRAAYLLLPVIPPGS